MERAEEAGTMDGRGISASGIPGGCSGGPWSNGLTGRRFRSAAARSAPARTRRAAIASASASLPTDSVAPTVSVALADSAAPTDSAALTGSVAPTDSVALTDSAAPTDSADPTALTDSAAPADPVAPADPADPAAAADRAARRAFVAGPGSRSANPVPLSSTGGADCFDRPPFATPRELVELDRAPRPGLAAPKVSASAGLSSAERVGPIPREGSAPPLFPVLFGSTVVGAVPRPVFLARPFIAAPGDLAP